MSEWINRCKYRSQGALSWCLWITSQIIFFKFYCSSLTSTFSEGTNGATVESMKGVNSLIRRFLSVVEVPVFGAAVLAILIMGEMNFFTTQVRYQTEPIASIGKLINVSRYSR